MIKSIELGAGFLFLVSSALFAGDGQFLAASGLALVSMMIFFFGATPAKEFQLGLNGVPSPSEIRRHRDKHPGVSITQAIEDLSRA
ncbi:hypothetical protein H5392_13970 [Tessaracoccus sp. MC1865]|uniref:hypothetical protein n=1 Tax=Tessaracoccus sp. MC1865 TaxID=2760310 RepID=UPI00160265E7|nr:hypothetical protein [Tessaracoccus sp. MC1865]MBB1484964.1 hypothetical protein [Tessaracoccus sp. MC1865]QTO38689.1 hypothetical protein J7D54_06355 [Tessaracoccus sp. MC1865]